MRSRLQPMNRSRARFATSRLAFAVGTVAIIAGITGCATAMAPADTVADATETAVATPSPTTRDATVTDEESCEVFTDVSTILQNATAGLHDERMTQQEYDGWLRLATRVLDRVPTRGEGAVSDAIDALKEAAPAVPAGTYGAASIGTPEWYAAAPLAKACSAAGYQIFAEGFTGG